MVRSALTNVGSPARDQSGERQRGQGLSGMCKAGRFSKLRLDLSGSVVLPSG